MTLTKLKWIVKFRLVVCTINLVLSSCLLDFNALLICITFNYVFYFQQQYFFFAWCSVPSIDLLQSSLNVTRKQTKLFKYDSSAVQHWDILVPILVNLEQLLSIDAFQYRHTFLCPNFAAPDSLTSPSDGP